MARRQDHLVAPAWRHWFHRNTRHGRLRGRRLDSLEQLGILTRGLVRRPDVQSHATQGAPVDELAGNHFHRHRKPHGFGLLGGVLRARRQDRLDHRDPIRLQDVLGLDLVEAGEPGASQAHEDPLHLGTIGLERRQDVPWRLIEQGQVARVLDHVHIGPDGVLRGVERRNMVDAEHLHRFSRHREPHE